MLVFTLLFLIGLFLCVYFTTVYQRLRFQKCDYCHSSACVLL